MFDLIKEYTSFGSEIDLTADADYLALKSPRTIVRAVKIISAGSGTFNFRASGIDQAVTGLADGENVDIKGITAIRTGTNVAKVRVSWA